MGPGLSLSAAPEAVRAALESQLPAVVDADALNIIARNESLRPLLGPRHVITPHPGEAARLIGPPGDDQVRAAMRLRDETGAVALLKGASSVIAGEGLYVSASGCGGMATGGSGDVLSGIIVSLLGQGVPPLQAAALGACLHGAAGDLCAGEIGECGLLAGGMIDACARLLK